MKCPCKDCSSRFVGCHSKCPAYQSWKKIEDELKAKEREHREQESLIIASYNPRKR